MDDTIGILGGIWFLIFFLSISIFMIVASWRIYTKAGKPGWTSIIPIYNAVVWMEIAKRPGWWVLLLFIPFVNIVIAIIANIDVAKNFGKDTGFGIGLSFLSIVFVPILAFGDAQYQGLGSQELEEHLIA